MTEIIGVRFKEVSKIYYFDPTNIKFKKGDKVIVETVRGIELGEIVLDNRSIPEEDIVAPLRQVIRAATEEDLKSLRKLRLRRKSAFGICEKKIREHKLDMKLVDVEYTSLTAAKYCFISRRTGVLTSASL